MPRKSADAGLAHARVWEYANHGLLPASNHHYCWLDASGMDATRSQNCHQVCITTLSHASCRHILAWKCMSTASMQPLYIGQHHRPCSWSCSPGTRPVLWSDVCACIEPVQPILDRVPVKASWRELSVSNVHASNWIALTLVPPVGSQPSPGSSCLVASLTCIDSMTCTHIGPTSRQPALSRQELLARLTDMH